MAEWSPVPCTPCSDLGGPDPGEPTPGIDIEYSDCVCDLGPDGEVLGFFQYKIVHDEDGNFVSSDAVGMDGVTPYVLSGIEGKCPNDPVGVDIEYSDCLCDLDADGNVLGYFQYRIEHGEDGLPITSDPVAMDGITPYAIVGTPGKCPEVSADTIPCVTCP